jgi:fatty acid desaturase
MRVDDPRAVEFPWYANRTGALLNDPRDVVFVTLIVECALFAACGLGLYFAGPLVWVLAPVYWVALVAVFLDRFTLMLHCTSHRPLFKPRFRQLNSVIPWVLGPFFGQTPNTYFAHHVGMHHLEENMPDDLSSTLGYQRDSFLHWLRYCGRFLFVGLFDLTRYFSARRRPRLLRRVVVGEVAYFAVTGALLVWNPAATVAVFIGPLVAIRTLMMMGNWSQHAFVSQENPEDAYLASITCINSRYNRRCFNDGYHIGHHLSARTHWTEYPAQFEANAAEYARKDAIVFQGVDYFSVWLLLMTKRYRRLAQVFVQLPGATPRDEAAIIALLKARVRPVHCATPIIEASVVSTASPPSARNDLAAAE